ncbi:heterokaryon incompatibility protein-domain-containing protein [Cladorrhinum sp. PSN259]|nr:heterokaryon incompatibility protein-domain-containing protein [Cladorrhinum sp. PSN259]
MPTTMPANSLYSHVRLEGDGEVSPIRILTLLPGSFDDDLVVRLHATNLSQTNRPQYEALSYVWGLPKIESPHQIMVMTGDLDVAYMCPLDVTEHLDSALRHLRYPDTARTLWIDAICIDQNNLEERNSQVANMASVYKLAVRVVVWLGPEADDSGLAMWMINDISSKVTVNWVSYTLAPATALKSDELHWVDSDCPLPYPERELCAIEKLFQRPWFSRLWVIQEVRLTTAEVVVICGFTSVSWKLFLNSSFVLYFKGGQRPVLLDDLGSQGFLQRLTTMHDPAVTLHLPYLLQIASYLQCTDNRDRVYALVPLTSFTLKQLNITPDYSATLLTVYRSLVLHYIEFFGDLDIITSLVGNNRISATTSLRPSWIPPFEFPSRTNYSSRVQASGPFAACFSSLNEDILRVAGVRCATVTEVDVIHIPEADLQYAYSELKRIAPPNPTEQKYVTGCSIIEAFATTLTCCDGIEYDPPNSSVWSPQQVETWMAQLLAMEPEQAATASEDVAAKMDRFIPWLHNNTQDRAFVRTKEGYFALVPDHTQPGDIICALFGLSDTIVLRRTGNDRYSVVGACFVYGLAFGEAIFGKLPEGQKQISKYDEEARDYRWFYRNERTGESTDKDPRYDKIKNQAWTGFGDMSEDYERLILDREELAKLGVMVEDFDLV